MKDAGPPVEVVKVSPPHGLNLVAPANDTNPHGEGLFRKEMPSVQSSGLQSTIAKRIAIGAIVAFLLLFFAWFMRFDIRPTPPAGTYVLDRWTGGVQFCDRFGKCKDVTR
jgi:hypothetical protein